MIIWGCFSLGPMERKTLWFSLSLWFLLFQARRQPAARCGVHLFQCSGRPGAASPGPSRAAVKECSPHAAPSSSHPRAPCPSGSPDTVIPFLRKCVGPTAQHFSACLQGDFLIKVHSDCAQERRVRRCRPLSPSSVWCSFCYHTRHQHLSPGVWFGEV